MRFIIAFLTLVLSTGSYAFSFGKKAVPVEENSFETSWARVLTLKDQISMGWTARDMSDREFGITMMCDNIRSTIWNYKFPGQPGVKVDGLAMLMVRDVGNDLSKIDLETESRNYMVIFDSNYAIDGSANLEVLVKDSKRIDVIPEHIKFLWVGYKANHTGTWIVASGPKMSAEGMFGRMQSYADFPRTQLDTCSRSMEEPSYKVTN